MGKEKRRKEKEKELVSQLTHLNPSIATPGWNHCISSVQFTLSSSNLNSSLIDKIEERKWIDGGDEMRLKTILFYSETAWKSNSHKKTNSLGGNEATTDYGHHHRPPMVTSVSTFFCSFFLP